MRRRSREILKRYSLVGLESQCAVEAGLAEGEWFRSEVPCKRMKELMRRSESDWLSGPRPGRS